MTEISDETIILVFVDVHLMRQNQSGMIDDAQNSGKWAFGSLSPDLFPTIETYKPPACHNL
jgi:hypothetical protein